MKVVLAHQNPQSTLLAVVQPKEAVLCQEEQGSGYLLAGGTVVCLSSMCPAYKGHCMTLWAATPPPPSAPELAGGLKCEWTLSVPVLACP